MGISFFFMILVLLGIGPLIAGIALILTARTRGKGHPACGRCGYDVTGSIGTVNRCPECGGTFTEVGVLPAGARRSRPMFWGGVMLLLFPLLNFGLFLGIPAVLSYRQLTANQQAVVAQQIAVAQQQALIQAQASQQAVPNQPQQQPNTPPESAQQPQAEIRTQDILIGGDEHKRYVLIGPAADAKTPDGGWKLLVVFPGGAGCGDFLPFVKRLAEKAMPDGVLVAMAVAPKWRDDEKRVVWPTRGLPDEKMQFPAEEFAEAIVNDAKAHAPIDERHIYALGWSSGGPAVYATLMQEKTAFDGAFVAMSVFKPQQLPPPANAAGRAFYILHSPQDMIAMHFPESARDQLRDAGARTQLDTYTGGHGWHGDVNGQVRRGLSWLIEQTNRTAKDPDRP